MLKLLLVPPKEVELEGLFNNILARSILEEDDPEFEEEDDDEEATELSSSLLETLS